MRKTADESPTPNQRTAKGIHASGERLRKKLTRGRKARRAAKCWPNQIPMGKAVKTASTNPMLTLKREVVISTNSRAVLISSTKPLATSCGEGNALRWNMPARQMKNQRPIIAAIAANGSRIALREFALTGIKNGLDGK